MAKRLIALVALLASACGGPAAPSPAVISLQVVGLPSSITLADTVALQAIAGLSDGTSAPVQHPTWSSSNPDIARVSDNGVVEALRSGPVTITVIAGKLVADARTSVIDAPSTAKYTLRGVVRASAPQGNTPVKGASVTIAGGWDAGLTATTDAAGGFVLANVSAPFGSGFPVRVSSAGYRDASFTVVKLPRDEQADVPLEPAVGCAYAVTPAALWAYDHVPNGSFDVTTSPGCTWTASLIDGLAGPGYFRFAGSTTGTGSGRLNYSAFSTYGSTPYVYTVRIEGPNAGSAIYVVRVNAR